MGNQSASRLHGDDFQHLYSWIKILDLLNPNTHLSHIWVENPSAAAADDLTIHPKDPKIHPTKYYQIKAHRDLSKAYSMEELSTPSKPNSKSLLQSLWDSWQKLKAAQSKDSGDIEIWLVSDWQADTFLGDYIRDGAFTNEFIDKSLNTKTNVGKGCKKWKDHLGLKKDEQEFRDFCLALRFELGLQFLSCKELATSQMRSYKLKEEDTYINNGIGIVREWIKEGQRQEITAGRLLKKIDKENLWAAKTKFNHPLLTIEQRFEQESSRALENISSEISGIGHIPRQEVDEIEGYLNTHRKVILLGDAGTGKSGIAASLVNKVKRPDKLVLYLDARHFSFIKSEPDLKNHLDLDCDLLTAITEVANYKNCRIIIDQFDNVIGFRAANVLINIALKSSRLPDVEVLVVSRRSKAYIQSNDIKQFIGEGFVQQPSNLLDENTARKSLESLRIPQPSEDLVQLARNLLDLEIISLIKHQDNTLSDFSNITNKVVLWERYLDTIISRESIGDGSDHANRIVAEATRLACKGLTEDKLEITLDNPINKYQLRLIGTMLTPLMGRVYRFRHEELQYFLYACEAIEVKKTQQAIAKEIGGFMKNVIPWMKRLLKNKSSEPEYDKFLRETFLDVK